MQKFYHLLLLYKTGGQPCDQFCKTRLIIVSGAAALRSGTAAKDDHMEISNLKKIIPIVEKLASLVARQLGHWYMNGMAYGKHLVALAIGNIFMCSDRELPEELKERRLLTTLGYKNPPDHSIFSKIRKDVGEEKIGRLVELIIHELYRNRVVSCIAIDSTYIPHYFEKDYDAEYGYVTLTKRSRNY